MDTDKILAASAVLDEIATNFANMPEEKVECVAASLHLRIVQVYLLDLAKHLTTGSDPYDAMIKAAVGDSPITAA